jgi:hypothetical protein
MKSNKLGILTDIALHSAGKTERHSKQYVSSDEPEVSRDTSPISIDVRVLKYQFGSAG